MGIPAIRTFAARDALPPAQIACLGSVEIATLSFADAPSIDPLQALAYARADKFVLAIVESGAVMTRSRGREALLEESKCGFFDCAAPLSFAAARPCRVLAIFIPAFMLQARLRCMSRINGQALACNGSPWRIAASLIRMLASEIRHIPGAMAYNYANQIVEAISVAVEADAQAGAESGGRGAIFRRCAAYVRGHLSDPSLSPNKIAEAMSISVRYLHKVFQESDESVCDFLRAARLETSRSELADPLKAAVQVREIAHRVGFRNQAHFAAAFKTRYGVSASQWRRDALRAHAAASGP